MSGPLGDGGASPVPAGSTTGPSARATPASTEVTGPAGNVGAPGTVPAYPGRAAGQPAAALSVDPATLELRPTAGGGLAGAMTVTVRNSGDAAVANAVVTFILPTEIGPAGGAWDGCTMTSSDSIRIDCPLGRLDAHTAPAFTFEFVATGQPRVVGVDQSGRYVPSNHYLIIGQRRPYTREVGQNGQSHEADILIVTP